jgi:hypothetical protein
VLAPFHPVRWSVVSLDFWSGPLYIGPMTDERNEKLRCPSCGRTGMASLSQGEADDTPIVHVVPDGFKAVQTEYGPDFRCGTCDIAVEP